MTPIMGQSLSTVEQCELFLRKQNPNAPYLAYIYKNIAIFMVLGLNVHGYKCV
jgi:hypothetical protein